MMFHSLRFKVSFFAALIMSMVILAISGVFIASEQTKGRQQILDNGRNFATFSSQSIYDNYVRLYTHPTNEEFEQFKQAVQTVLGVNSDVVHVTLLSISGRILFDSSEFKDGKYKGAPREIEDETLLESIKSDQTIQRDYLDPKLGRVADIIVPINESGVGHVLSTRYTLSYASLSKRTGEIFLQTASVAIPLMVVVVIVAIVFSLTLTRPIIKLTKVAQEIRAGNFTIKANVTSKDELGTLGLTFDEMTEQLNQTYGRLNRSLHELTEEKARSSASIDSLPLGFMMTDEKGEPLVTNPAIRKILDDAKNAELKKQLKTHIEACLTHKTPINLPELTESGRFFRAFLSPVVLADDPHKAAIGVAVLLEDITEEKILARSKEEFFSIASHELRTPLTAIRGNARMILDYFADALKNNDLKDMMVDIHGSSVRLIDIVNDFLDASRLEQGKMAFKTEPFAIADVIKDVTKDLATVVADKHIELRLSPDLAKAPQVSADQNKTKQIVYNLIGNALKFTDEGHVEVTAEVTGKLLKVYISDTGKGMSAENQSLLFHKFQQATDSILTRDNTRGTGLGLYISKLLIENMGGTVKLENTREGKGSTFSFTLPLASSPKG